MKIFLFSYLNAFSDGKDKLHPGFSVDGTVCILTHTKPWKRQYISIPSAVVRSDHFKARSDFVYLAIADEGRVRYNNLAGGSINLDSLLLTKISQFLKKPLKSFIQITVNTTTMTKVIFSWPVLAVAIKYLPSTQQECFPEGVDISPEMLIPSSEGEIVTMEQLYTALCGKTEEELQSFVDAFPNQMDALATAVLSGTLEKVYPAITAEKAASLLPYREEIVTSVEALLNGDNDDQKLAAVAQLEQLLGDTVAIPETVTEAPAQPEEPAATTDAEPTVEGEDATEVVPATATAELAIISNGTVAASKVGELAEHFAATLDNVAAGYRTMSTMFKQPTTQE